MTDPYIKYQWEGIKYQWEDCTIGFICPNCGEELVADSQNGEDECDCGLKYCLTASLKVK